mmetsp:Transcript_59562/g.156986  ORF Transcript_59562/g.156986 Transcript_59562/m.156986 type:complete len:242 (+) Transcript_59562:728-1453(+)
MCPRQSSDSQPSGHLVKVVEHSGEVSLVCKAHRITIHHGSVLPDSARPAAHIQHLLNVWVLQVDDAVVLERDRELGAAPATLAVRPAVDEAPVAEHGLEVSKYAYTTHAYTTRFDKVGRLQILDAECLPFLRRERGLWAGFCLVLQSLCEGLVRNLPTVGRSSHPNADPLQTGCALTSREVLGKIYHRVDDDLTLGEGVEACHLPHRKGELPPLCWGPVLHWPRCVDVSLVVCLRKMVKRL